MFKTLSSKAASLLDQELMSTGAFSIDQLMELAGLAVAKSIFKEYPPTKFQNCLILAGPGNNGGDALVAARHLKLWNYNPILYYPKKSKSNQLYLNIATQLQQLKIKEIESIEDFKSTASSTDLIVDGLFGFSFKPPIRAPFDETIKYLSETKNLPPIVSIDVPSGWDVDEGAILEHNIIPSLLISLTAPKPCASIFVEKNKNGKHYLGGRFINEEIAKKYDIEELIKKYKNDDLVVKL
ncbi:unnamed protein product [Candida verbasci]|uniref:NAD(P)H-hydrate epimerase n=1 Tax=Candida verbasci TaxID=1227364 RepID=A0A9W4XHF2_9ASCO|nr:unnamed protein product [Candida verbasci]